jgi:Zn-dependent protease with chaperone function
MRTRQIQTAILSLLVFLPLAPVAQARVEPTHGFDLFSPQEEIQAGQQAAAQVEQQLPILPDDDPITKYVQQLGAKLAEHAPGEKWPYTFHVVNQKEINAFALPGGPIFVNLGTIQAADNEAQLAGVLAHEISHVVQRHGTRAASKQMAAQLPLAIIGGMMGRTTLSRAAQLGISFGVGSYFLRNSRQSESEADLLGTDIMYDAGFDPRQMAVFFAKLKEEADEQSAVAQFLSDHPDPGNRAGAVSQEVKTLPARKYSSSSAEFAAIKKQAGGVQPMTAEQVEAWRKEHSVASSHPESTNNAEVALTRQFDHSQYQISYPENWQVTGDANSAVTIAPQNGTSGDAIVYGVLINSYPGKTAGDDLNVEMNDLINSIRQSNSGMRPIGEAEDIRVNGMAGKSVDLVGRSPETGDSGKSKSERDWLVAIQRQDGSLLYTIFASPESDFEEMRPVFERMLKSLKLK